MTATLVPVSLLVSLAAAGRNRLKVKSLTECLTSAVNSFKEGWCSACKVSNHRAERLGQWRSQIKPIICQLARVSDQAFLSLEAFCRRLAGTDSGVTAKRKLVDELLRTEQKKQASRGRKG